MNCPKCGGRLHEYTGGSRISALNRQSGYMAVPIHGVSCILCGFWGELDVEVVPMPVPEPKPRKVPILTLTESIVEELWHKGLKNYSGSSIKTIIWMLRRVHPMHYKPATVLKAMERMRKKK